VIAAASSQEKVDLCLKHGADEGVVYGRAPFDRDAQKQLSDQFKAACGPNGADAIYDPIGDDYASRRCGRSPGRASTWWSASPPARSRRSR
jgi:NADPH2:quinone reductase